MPRSAATMRRRLLLAGMGILCAGSAALQMGCEVLLDTLLDTLVLAEVGVGAHELSFTATAGGAAPAAQVVEASCTIPSADFFSTETCTADLTTDQPWLIVDPSTIDGVEDVAVSVDSTGLDAGTYTGNIHVQYIFVSPDDEENITVTLTVQAAE